MRGVFFRGFPKDVSNQARQQKPELTLQSTTLWEYSSQHYGRRMQGDQAYKGATPSHVIWNLLSRYTRQGDLVVDPMCGSGTTIDVSLDLDRKVKGFDLAPFRDDIGQADARNLLLGDESADFVFLDPPYGDNLNYSDHPDCIGRLSALEETYYSAMDEVFGEISRILKNRRYMALYVCDVYQKKKGFAAIGFRLFEMLTARFKPVDIISVVRHNRTLKRRHWHSSAIEGNYFLRGFNYLFVMKKET